MEVGIPVAVGAGGEGRVAAGELPSGTMVSTWHLGAHDRLSDAYTALQAWLNGHGHQPAGPGWEVYHWIDLDQEPDPARWPDPTSWRSQLIQPIS
jgi:effector-binding domain-containing protein